MATGRQDTTRDGDTEDMVPVRGVQSPPTIHRVNRRPLGIEPVPLLIGALALTVLAAIVLIAVGGWVAGIVLLAGAVALAALVLVAVEREPDDPAARAAVAAADRARSRTRLIAVAAKAWSRAALVVVRVRERRYRLRWRLRQQLEPLGEAAYKGDEERVELLRAEAQKLEDALEAGERERSAAVKAARREIERERAVSDATQTLPSQGPPEGGA